MLLLLQEVLMGKDEYFRSFRENADNFICGLLPGISGGSGGTRRSSTPPAASSSRWATATCST